MRRRDLPIAQTAVQTILHRLRLGDPAAADRPTLFPVLDWLPRNQWSGVGADVVAGLALAALLIPESMAHRSWSLDQRRR